MLIAYDEHYDGFEALKQHCFTDTNHADIHAASRLILLLLNIILS